MAQNEKFHFVFVYGTLKKGEPNYQLLAEEKNGLSEFVGCARTIEKYPLVIGSKYNIPFLLDIKYETGHNIMGEVYRVDDEMLANLDILENHPEFYVRRKEPVQLKLEQETNTIFAWIYFLPNFKRNMLTLPMIASYSSTGDHGLEYIPSEYLCSVDEI